MRDIDLFQLALGLVPPWMVADAKFDADKKRLDIEIDFKAGGRFSCPECGKVDCPVHDTVKKTWRHLNFFQHQAFLHARVPRIDCPDHGVRLVTVPWARPGSGFTLLFEAFVMTLVKGMPVAAAARLVGEHDTRLWRVSQGINSLVQAAKAKARGYRSLRNLMAIVYLIAGKIDHRGRDAGYPAPPAQVRTGPIKAYGSHLG
jgi:transposase